MMVRVKMPDEECFAPRAFSTPSPAVFVGLTEKLVSLCMLSRGRTYVALSWAPDLVTPDKDTINMFAVKSPWFKCTNLAEWRGARGLPRGSTAPPPELDTVTLPTCKPSAFLFLTTIFFTVTCLPKDDSALPPPIDPAKADPADPEPSDG